MTEPILALAGLRAGYGKTVVLENLDLDVAPGECISVIGRNGVGKTTLLGTIMGHTTLHSGRILLGGADITKAQIQNRVGAGIGYVPQEREVFSSLTVEENLDVAARPGGDWTRDRVYDMFSNLAARRTNRGNQLSGGEQQMLAIGRALMGNPRILLMDEPSEGLAPVIVEELQKAMARLRADGGMTMILVEQNTRVALGFGERTIVMNRGMIIHDGPSAALKADPDRLVELMGLGVGAAG
jgi:branched-chain amino acid transport system ATP-binding protein